MVGSQADRFVKVGDGALVLLQPGLRDVPVVVRERLKNWTWIVTRPVRRVYTTHRAADAAWPGPTR